MTPHPLPAPRGPGAVRALGFLLLTVALAGCGATEPPCPASGRVQVNGKPAEGVYVALYPTGGAVDRPAAGSARTDKDGAFALQVPGPGEYAVTAFWPAITLDGGDRYEGEDRLKGKYRDPGHPVQAVALAAGENTIPPLELKSP